MTTNCQRTSLIFNTNFLYTINSTKVKNLNIHIPLLLILSQYSISLYNVKPVFPIHYSASVPDLVVACFSEQRPRSDYNITSSNILFTKGMWCTSLISTTTSLSSKQKLSDNSGGSRLPAATERPQPPSYRR